MSAWKLGCVCTRVIGAAYVEIRDDVCDGWSWTLYRGSMSCAFGEATTLDAAQRAAMRAAKRLGWTR